MKGNAAECLVHVLKNKYGGVFISKINNYMYIFVTLTKYCLIFQSCNKIIQGVFRAKFRKFQSYPVL